jgi:phosphoribosylglycinamide formyltransferase-1
MKFIFYTSRNAGRAKAFLGTFSEESSAIKAIVHDGNRDAYENSMLNPDKLRLVNYNDQGIIKGEQSQRISDYILEVANEVNADYIFCFGSKILKGGVLDHYKNKIINFHPSLLPAFPGLCAIDQALNAKALLLGNTAHFIDEGIDTGPVIMQSLLSSKKFKVYEDVLNMQIFMLKQIMIWLREGRIQIRERNVYVEDADYTIREYVPSLEFDV